MTKKKKQEDKSFITIVEKQLNDNKAENIIKIDLVGKKTTDGNILEKQSDVTDYLLSKAKLAIVPFSAFGGDANSPWYRVSVGVVKVEDIETVMELLENALNKLS